MLSLESLINYIEPKQISLKDNKPLFVPKKVKEKVYIAPTNKKLPDFFSDYFGDRVIDFNLYKNRNLSGNEFFNFINSLLICIDNSYLILKDDMRKEKIKSLLKDLIVNFDEQNLYYKFNYNKNRKITKTKIQEYLYKVLKNTTKRIDGLSDNYVDQFIVDYFGVNLVVFNVNDDNIVFEKSYILNTNRFENKFSKLVPVLFICVQDGKFHSVLKNDGESVVKYSENKDLINKLYIKFKININRKEQEGMTLAALRILAEEKGIEITKESEQTGKTIFKKKIELIDELGQLDFV